MDLEVGCTKSHIWGHDLSTSGEYYESQLLNFSDRQRGLWQVWGDPQPFLVAYIVDELLLWNCVQFIAGIKSSARKLIFLTNLVPGWDVGKFAVFLTKFNKTYEWCNQRMAGGVVFWLLYNYAGRGADTAAPDILCFAAVIHDSVGKFVQFDHVRD